MRGRGTVVGSTMTGGSSGLSSKSLETSAGSTSWDCLRLLESLNIDPRRPGFLCFGVSGSAGLEDEELGVGLPAGSTIDLDLSRFALDRNLGSLETWLEPVGDDGEGDVRDGLADIVVVGDGKRRDVCGRCRRGAIDSDSGAYRIRPPRLLPHPPQVPICKTLQLCGSRSLCHAGDLVKPEKRVPLIPAGPTSASTQQLDVSVESWPQATVSSMFCFACTLRNGRLVPVNARSERPGGA